RSSYFFAGTGSVLGAEHFANFLVVLSRHFTGAGAAAGLHTDMAANLPLASRHFPLASIFCASALLARPTAKARAVASISVFRMAFLLGPKPRFHRPARIAS